MVATIKASEGSDVEVEANRRLTLCLAALLHEADDHKFFGKDSANARSIMKEVLEGDSR